MAINNPITCVSLMAHETHISLYVHRKIGLSSYTCNKDFGKDDKPLRFHRMVSIFSETLKATYLEVTGYLSPIKW